MLEWESAHDAKGSTWQSAIPSKISRDSRECETSSECCDARPILQQAVISHRFHLIQACAILGMGVWLSGCRTVPGPGISDMAPETATPPPSTATIVWFPATSTSTPGTPVLPEPTPDMKPGIGPLIFSDDFSSPDTWNTASSAQASVAVGSNQLRIAVQPGIAPVASFRQGQIFRDMYAEITAQPSLCRGADDYGLAFRAPNNVAYYRLALACNGTVGAQRVSLSSIRVLQVPIASGDVPAGAPGRVRLGVWADGPELHFFLNGRYQFSVEDKSYASGAIGVFAHAAGSSPVTVAFSDMAVYAVTYRPSPTPPTP